MKRKFLTFLLAGASFFGLSAQNYIVGDSATILGSADGGSSWQSISNDSIHDDLQSIGIVNADTFYIGGTRGVFKTEDSGQVFTNVTTNWSGHDYNRANEFAIWNNGENVRVGGRWHRNPSIISDDHGVTWGSTTAGGRDNTLMSMQKAGTNLFTNDAQTISRYDLDYGSGTTQYQYADIGFNGIYNNGSTVIVVGINGYAFKTDDDGATWDAITLPGTPGDLLGVSGSEDGNTILIVGNDGYIARSIDGGGIWNEIAGGGTNGLYKAHFANGDTVYINTNSSSNRRMRILYSYDAGATFNLKEWETNDNKLKDVSTMHWIDGKTGFININKHSEFYFTNDGLETLDTIYKEGDSPIGSVMLNVHAIDENVIFAAFENAYNRGRVFKTEDRGVNWTEVIGNGSYRKREFYFVNDTTGYLVCDDGTLYTTTDGGGNWSNAAITDDTWVINSVHNGWIAGAGFRVYKTSDYVSWERSYPVPMNYNNPRKLQAVSDNSLYAVGDGGMVLKTTNSGGTWTPVIRYDDFTANLRALSFVDENTGWIVGEDGFVAFTDDGFATYTVQPTPTNETLLAVYANNANSVIAVGTNGIIIKTTDGGANWSILESGTTQTLRDVKFMTVDGEVAIPTLTVADPAELAFCPGATLSDVAYTVSDGVFGAGNEFTLQLSDASGSFATPTDLATQAGTESGVFADVALPLSLEAGAAYKLRVLGSYPAIAAAADTVITINPLAGKAALPTVGGGEETTICEGDNSNTLSTAGADDADTYVWSIFPAAAGSITGAGTDVVLDWAVDFTGEAKVVVAGENSCGTGETSDTLVFDVVAAVEKAATPTVAEAALCQGANASDISTTGAANADSYVWSVFPAEAGTFAGTGADVTLNWSAAFAGEAKVVVAGTNAVCGEGEASDSLTFSIDEQVVAAFTFTTSQLEVTFTNTSTNAASSSWDFDDASPVSTDESPVYEYAAEGTYNVTLSVENGLCSDNVSQDVTVDLVSLDVLATESVNVYPNPTSGQVNVTLVEPSVITVMGANGAVVEVLNVQAAGNVLVDLPGTGTYVISVNDDNYKVVVE